MNQSEKFRRLFCTEAIRKDLRTSSVRAAGFTWAAGTADFVLRIGSTAILARLLLPEQFGLIMMVMAVTAIADQFRDLGLSTATVQRREISHQEVTNLFWINVLAGILIAAVVCAASPLVSGLQRATAHADHMHPGDELHLWWSHGSASGLADPAIAAWTYFECASAKQWIKHRFGDCTCLGRLRLLGARVAGSNPQRTTDGGDVALLPLGSWLAVPEHQRTRDARFWRALKRGKHCSNH